LSTQSSNIIGRHSGSQSTRRVADAAREKDRRSSQIIEDNTHREIQDYPHILFFYSFFFFLSHISTSPQEKKADLMAVLSSVPASCVGSHRFLITKGTSFYQSFAWILESPRLVPSVLLIPPRGNPRILSRIMPH